jgi:4-amino-4-deoxy-L-arabinose transferase-like glycosyltransferase
VESGVYITPDTWSGLFCAAALLGALAVYRRGTLSSFLLAGAAVGAAAGSKYNAALVGVALLTAFALRGPTRRAWLLLLASVAAAVAVFVLTTPGALVEPGKVLDGVVFEARHYQKGHPGYTGSAFVDYLGALLRSDAVAVLLALVAVVAAVRGRWRGEVAVIGVFALTYFGLVSVQNVHFDRNLLPVLPAVALLAGFGVAALLDRLSSGARPRLVGASVVGGLLVVAGVAGIRQDLGMHDRIDQPARAQARAWLAANLPPGASIVRESYGPWLDSERFPNVIYWISATEGAKLPPDVAAVVLTEQTAGRYLENPAQYPTEAAAYRRVEDSMCRAVRFDDPWVEVLVPCR